MGVILLAAMAVLGVITGQQTAMAALIVATVLIGHNNFILRSNALCFRGVCSGNVAYVGKTVLGAWLL